MTPAPHEGKTETPVDMVAVYKKAMDLIRDALQKGERNTAYWLARGNQNDTKATAAALLLAQSTFLRHLGESEESIENLTEEDLAKLYIRRAHNRLRRQLDKDKKFDDQVARANLCGADGDVMPFDPADPKSSTELMKILAIEIAEDLGSREERERLVITLWTMECKGKEIIAAVREAFGPKVQISHATISRIVERFKDDMRRRMLDE